MSKSEMEQLLADRRRLRALATRMQFAKATSHELVETLEVELASLVLGPLELTVEGTPGKSSLATETLAALQKMPLLDEPHRFFDRGFFGTYSRQLIGRIVNLCGSLDEPTTELLKGLIA